MNKIFAICTVALALAACDSSPPSAPQSRTVVDMRNLDEDLLTGIEANPDDPSCTGAARSFDPRQVVSITDGPPCRVGAAMYGTRRVTLR
jgi:hypothetical protein